MLQSEPQLTDRLIGRMRAIAILEGVSLLLLLLVAVPLKHVFGVDAVVRAVGPLHGVALILYLVTVLEVWTAGALRAPMAMRCLFVALLPLGTFANDRSLRRVQQQLSATNNASPSRLASAPLAPGLPASTGIHSP